MIADFYTKSLQGSFLNRTRDIIMGLAPFPDEERVGEDEKMSKVTSVECSSTVGSSTVLNNLSTTDGGLKEKVTTYADVVRSNVGTNIGRMVRLAESPTLGGVSGLSKQLLIN